MGSLVADPAITPTAFAAREADAGASWCTSRFLLVLCRMGRKSFWVIVSGLGVVTVGWLIARLHLWLFDPLYRGAGQIRIKS